MRKMFLLLISTIAAVSCATIQTGTTISGNSGIGCIEGNCRDGQGTFRWKDGTVYKGSWINGYKSGSGTINYTDGTGIYTGAFLENKRCGYGVNRFPNGDLYEGNFLNNVPEGKGKYTYADGTVEEGIFSEYLFTGAIKLPRTGDEKKLEVSRIVEVKPSVFEVTVKDTGGLKMGEKLFLEIDNTMCAMEVIFPMMTVSRCRMIGGTRSFINKAKKNLPVYRMIQGIKKGNDTFLLPNGNKYIGEYRNDLMHGKGEFIWTNGNRYTGNFKNGKRDGKGKIVFYNGCSYYGDFKNGYYDGKGVFTWPSGSVYEGEFKKGFKNGKGTLNFYTGEKYTGDWKDNLKHGNGIQYKKDGSISQKGRWEKDNFIQ